MSDNLRARIATTMLRIFDEDRTLTVDMGAWIVADAVIAQLEADYILVPKGHTIARIRSAEKLGLTGDGK